MGIVKIFDMDGNLEYEGDEYTSQAMRAINRITQREAEKQYRQALAYYMQKGQGKLND